MSKAELHDLIELIPENETEFIYHILLKFIPSDLPSTDEITAIAEAKKSIEDEGVVPFDEIDW